MENFKEKIFICITKSNWGGAQKYIYDLATSLPRDKFDISVVFGEKGALAEKLTEKGIRTIELKNSQRDVNIFKDINFLIDFIKLLKKEKPGILHLNSSKMGFVGAIAGRLAGIKKIIFTAHGWAFNEDRPKWQKFIFWVMQTKTVFFCHQTIAVSEMTKKQLKPKWLQNKIKVIHNGIRQETLLSKDEAKDKIKSEIKNLRWIGTISELHKNKGLEYMVRGFSSLEKNILENLALVIIGEGEERKKLEPLIKGLGMEEKIFLVGKINTAQLFLKAFDIFILSSITEALPYSILETGLANIPIIASNVGGIPEIIENDVTGMLIPARQPDKIAIAITEILNNPEKASILASNLNDKVKTKFSIEQMIEKTVGIYEK
jgi:glycosyltransferase involved in cell wall biosynthesis